MNLRIIFTVALLICSASYGEYAPNIPANVDMNQLVYRLASRYGLKVPENQFFQPFNYAELKVFLDTVNLLHGDKLSLSERFLIDKYTSRNDPGQGRMRWSSSSRDINVKLHLKLFGDIQFSFNDNSSIGLKGIISPSLYANTGKFSFYSGIDVWTEYQSDTLFKGSSYQPYDGIPYNLFGRNVEQSHVRSSDIPFGGFIYKNDRFMVETAIDYLKIGPAVYFPVTLSGTAPPVNYLKGKIDFGIFNYTHLAGLLKAQKDRSKYIYVHRINSSFLHSRLNFGINEVIITGSSIQDPHENDSNRVIHSQERQWEWAYLIPLVPFKFVEHYTGDRDNAALSFDVNLIYPQNFRWYLEFFMDDILSPLKIFTDDFGNKWAMTGGMQYFGSLFGRDFAVNAEYSHVEPWVYTHFFGGSHRYSHFDQCLGSPLGPNSQAIILEAYSQINNLNEIGIGLRCLAQNTDARGGKLTDVFQDENRVEEGQFFDKTTKRFLGPGTKWQLRPTLSWNFNPFGIFCIKARYEIDLQDKARTSSFSIWGGLSF
jgi:hypothetical protein